MQWFSTSVCYNHQGALQHINAWVSPSESVIYWILGVAWALQQAPLVILMWRTSPPHIENHSTTAIRFKKVNDGDVRSSWRSFAEIAEFGFDFMSDKMGVGWVAPTSSHFSFGLIKYQ